MGYQFKNLIFEGGGVLGVAYVGVLEVLTDKNYNILPNIERAGGTSAGAIVALLVGLNYSLDEVRKEMENLDLSEFMDDNALFTVNTIRFMHTYGWYKGDVILDWIERKVCDKTGSRDSTFEDIQKMKNSKNFKDLYFIGTNMNTHFSRIFSHEEKHTPTMRVADAVRISMSIPLFFEAIKYEEDLYADGGILMNYPIKLFDREKYLSEQEHGLTREYYLERSDIDGNTIYNTETLGFRVDSKILKDVLSGHRPPKRHDISNMYEFTKNLIGTILDFQQNVSLTDDDKDRTVYIDSNEISATHFKITPDEKKKLIISGKESTIQYFASFNNQEIEMRNRPS
ncbi:patatin-like phospholipase family protein [Paenibacillus alba]|uniref:Patatin-like phospholipase family protein n=1 Tax=Paenibacillus alba TaxID=1197127 RepID=A0ABU6G0C2_9BACL|nr:patatin-like phospholipase family protein [Paenibacillus alba]MEC0227572.1 patatin-like phospholipase family protein [Paenibacillus alba]